MKPLRLVAPFLPMPPDNPHHLAMQDFDWMAAIRMLSHSGELACGVPVQVLTDTGADLPVPALKYTTTHRRLMLWVLEVCIQYLESGDFDRDTVALDCDQLIYGDLRPFFTPYVDLGILVRQTRKHRDTWKKVLNGVQFWPLRGKPRLADFYRRALAHAETLGEGLIEWGADTAALRNLLEPIQIGMRQRAGIAVQFHDYTTILEALSADHIDAMQRGVAPRTIRPVLDFRYKRKEFMPLAYEMTIGKAVPTCAS